MVVTIFCPVFCLCNLPKINNNKERIGSRYLIFTQVLKKRDTEKVLREY